MGFTLVTFDDSPLPPPSGLRPDAITQLAALAAATTHIGLVATQNTTYNFPADLALRLSTLDFLSGGRADWNIDAVRILPGTAVVLGAVDGFNFSPHLVPAALDDIVDKPVPELQDRGVYRTAYEGTTLREHLALPELPAG